LRGHGARGERAPSLRRCSACDAEWDPAPPPAHNGDQLVVRFCRRSAIDQIPLNEIDLLVIENVGNLVCPAEFTVGEHQRWMISSVTEGDEKPLKYPLMFRTCSRVVLNKIDLLPHVDFSVDRVLASLDQVNPAARMLEASARSGEGMDAWRALLLHQAAAPTA
jgi:hydrogenase accessory protein HypB